MEYGRKFDVLHQQHGHAGDVSIYQVYATVFLIYDPVTRLTSHHVRPTHLPLFGHNCYQSRWDSLSSASLVSLLARHPKYYMGKLSGLRSTYSGNSLTIHLHMQRVSV
jgi:hypothetical protein